MTVFDLAAPLPDRLYWDSSFLNRTTEDSYISSPTVGHFPARPERSGAKSKDAASSSTPASTSPCGLRSA